MLLIRRIRELLYEHGFTISGARNKLDARALPAPTQTMVNEQTGLDPNKIRRELEQILAILKL